MRNNNLAISFYVVKDEIKINHIGNTSDEIAAEMGFRKGYRLLLFKYDTSDQKLAVTNIDNKSLKLILESIKNKKKTQHIDNELSDAISQIEVAAKFLRKTYGWGGEIISGEERGLDDKVALSLFDLGIVSDYLRFFFGNYNAEIFDIDIFIIDSLEEPSMFLEYEEEYGDIEGPAILVKKVNSMYSICESVIYQYVLNYDKIIKFDVGLREEYIFDAKAYVDEAILGFFRNEVIDNRSFWYLKNKGSKIYLHKNYDVLSDSDLSKHVGGTVLSFEYVISGDSRYIIINNVPRESVRDLSVYSEMFDFLMDHLDKIGHVKDNGKKIKENPVVLFRPAKRKTTPMLLSHMPIWVFIENVLSIVYDFDPEDIIILKGEFSCDKAFSIFRDRVEMVKKIGNCSNIKDENFPIIVWNSRVEESSITELISLLSAYASFIGKEKFGNLFEFRDMHRVLEYIRKNVVCNEEKAYAIEHALMILIQETEHIHEYNIFKIVFGVMGFYSSLVDNYLSEIDDDEQIENVAECIDYLQERLYYLILKATLAVSKIKFGANIDKKRLPIKGDLVMDNNMERLLRVILVSMEPHLVSRNNPEGILLHCEDVLSGKPYEVSPDSVFAIALSFGDSEVYNYRKASRNKMLKAEKDELGIDNYKKLLEPFLKNKKKKNPLDDSGEEMDDIPSFEERLREQSRYFERERPVQVVEHLLEKCRKVKNYDNESGR